MPVRAEMDEFDVAEEREKFGGDEGAERGESGSGDSDDDDDSSSSSAAIAPPAGLAEFSLAIDAAIARLGGKALPKLDWSAPLDAAWLRPGGSLECSSADAVNKIRGARERGRERERERERERKFIKREEWKKNRLTPLPFAFLPLTGPAPAEIVGPDLARPRGALPSRRSHREGQRSFFFSFFFAVGGRAPAKHLDADARAAEVALPPPRG